MRLRWLPLEHSKQTLGPCNTVLARVSTISIIDKAMLYSLFAWSCVQQPMHFHSDEGMEFLDPLIKQLWSSTVSMG